tara:strand:- start:337 stop:627 length:291 start_codon:yes stop_codon:yes gene_type:complete
MNYNPLPIFCTIKASSINGLGLFATKKIKKDTELGISHIEVDDIIYRTPLGGFINHAEQSNCVRVKVNNKWYLKTTKDIMNNEELTLTYSLYKPNG